MSDRSYIQHGRRHGRRGSDPVDSGIAWAYAWNTTVFSYAYPGGGGPVFVDLDGFATNDESVFDLGADSYAAGVNTIRFLSEGVYKFTLSANIFSPAINGAVELYYNVPLIQSALQFDDPDFVLVASTPKNAGFWELLYGDTPNDSITFPVGGGAFFETSTPTQTFDAYVSMYVEQVGVSRIALS